MIQQGCLKACHGRGPEAGCGGRGARPGTALAVVRMEDAQPWPCLECRPGAAPDQGPSDPCSGRACAGSPQAPRPAASLLALCPSRPGREKHTPRWLQQRGRGPRWPEQDLHPLTGPAAARPGVKMGHYPMASSPGTTFRGAGGRPSQTTSLAPCASAVSSTCPPGGSSVGLAMSGQSFSGLSHFCRN